MIVPIALTAAILGALALSSTRASAAPKPSPSPSPSPGPSPTPAPSPPRPFRGLPYGTRVRIKPEARVYGLPAVAKIVGLFNKETEPFFTIYAGIDDTCLLPDNLCTKHSVSEHDIQERLS